MYQRIAAPAMFGMGFGPRPRKRLRQSAAPQPVTRAQTPPDLTATIVQFRFPKSIAGWPEEGKENRIGAILLWILAARPGGVCTRVTGFGSRLKLAANGLYARTRPAFFISDRR
jgi:hypothetical protein